MGRRGGNNGGVEEEEGEDKGKRCKRLKVLGGVVSAAGWRPAMDSCPAAGLWRVSSIDLGPLGLTIFYSSQILLDL